LLKTMLITKKTSILNLILLPIIITVSVLNVGMNWNMKGVVLSAATVAGLNVVKTTG
jgi:hypothetical protein